MELDSFSAVLQLAATLNIAFVAVEYAKGYTNTLSEKVFRLPKRIEEAFKPLISKIPDKETLDTIKPHELDGKSTRNMIEDVKRKRERFNENTQKAQENLNNKVTDLCQSKSFSSLSLYFSIYSIIALFVSGFNTKDNCNFQVAWTMFTSFSFILAVIGWIVGEKEKQSKFFDFSSLRHTLLFLLIIILLSALCGCVNYQPSTNCWDFVIVFTVILPFLSFIMFFFKIKHKVRDIKKSITDSAKQFEEEANIITKETDVLLSSCKLDDYLSTQEKETDKTPDLSWL